MSKIFPQKPFLLLLYGYPGAGKTYFSRQFCEDVQAAHLQADKIRNELFEEPKYDNQENGIVDQLVNYMAEEFLAAGLSVVCDTNATRLSQRKAFREMANRHNAKTILVWFQVDMETCFARNVKRDRRRADDKYSGGWDRTTFDQIVAHMQNPSQNEEFVVVSGKHLYPTQRNAVIAGLRDKGMVTLQDAPDNMAKPGMVNLIPGRTDVSRRNILIR